MIDFDDLDWRKRPYSRGKAFGDSKLANLLFIAQAVPEGCLHRNARSGGGCDTSLPAEGGRPRPGMHLARAPHLEPSVGGRRAPHHPRSCERRNS